MTTSGDAAGKKLGMWLFLYTEIILFGGLFVLYAAYFNRYTAEFVESGRTLSRSFGIVNTLLLLVSSFAVAASVTAVQRKERGKALAALFSALLCGLVFLVNKYIEWGDKIAHGIYPNSDRLVDGTAGENMFFGLYYVITGLHGLHVVIGMALLLTGLVLVRSGRINGDRYALLENAGLYWHLVDLIWIFIFPLFYLVI